METRPGDLINRSDEPTTGKECYCANKITVSSSPSTGQPAPAGDCWMPCSGDSSQTCGAGNRISIYTYAQPLPTGWSVKGCYTDEISNRYALWTPYGLSSSLSQVRSGLSKDMPRPPRAIRQHHVWLLAHPEALCLRELSIVRSSLRQRGALLTLRCPRYRVLLFERHYNNIIYRATRRIISMQHGLFRKCRSDVREW